MRQLGIAHLDGTEERRRVLHGGQQPSGVVKSLQPSSLDTTNESTAILFGVSFLQTQGPYNQGPRINRPDIGCHLSCTKGMARRSHNGDSSDGGILHSGSIGDPPTFANVDTDGGLLC